MTTEMQPGQHAFDPKTGKDRMQVRRAAAGIFAGADPRLSYRSMERVAQADRRGGGGHSGRGDFGVLNPAAPSPTIRARHEVRQAPAAVVDERGWPVPTHDLVREGDELVLFGPAIDLATRRPCLLVIRAPDGTWHRPLTDRELAVLQGFPADCQLEGPSSSSKSRPGRREHIGNAIPPPTAEAIAREVAACLRSSTRASFLVGGDVWVERAEEAATA
jgi:site-specific DNA-cytosine methylase